MQNATRNNDTQQWRDTIASAEMFDWYPDSWILIKDRREGEVWGRGGGRKVLTI